MKLTFSDYINTIYYLVLTDFTLFRRTIVDKIIDLMIWVCTTTFVTAYFLPEFGMETTFVNLMITSLIASAGLFEQYASVTNIISDLEGANTLSYYLTLPVPTWMVFMRSLVFYSFNSAVLSILVLPASSLIAWNRLNFSQLSVTNFFIVFIVTNIFYASSTLWIASYTKNMERISSVWMRFIYPAWYFGGYQFTWQTMYAFNSLLGVFVLLNPMVYVMEATKNSILGPTGLLPFALCILMIIICTVLFTWHGIKRLKKRLDFC